MEKKFLDEVIDKREGAFLSGKSLMHGVVVANEVIDKARRKKKPSKLAHTGPTNKRKR